MCACGIVDSHLHLQDFPPGTDVHGLVRTALASGVSHLVCNGTSEEDWAEVLEFAESHPQVIPCFGVHPWFTGMRTEEWSSVLEEMVRSTVSGVGEIGLDRNREPFDRDAQEDAFRVQLDIARRYRRPAMVHCVKSWGWMMDVFRSEPRLPCGMLMHSYGGPPDLVRELAERGTYFSFSGKVLEPNYERARKSLLAVPSDRLLIETDAPCMLPPEKYRPHRMPVIDGDESNHPANLPTILNGIAELLGEDADRLRERLWENAQKFFGPVLSVEDDAK